MKIRYSLAILLMPMSMLMLAGPALASAQQPSAVRSAAPQAAPPALPFEQAMILIRSSLSALQQANETRNYTVLQAIGARSFQIANPPARLEQIFASLQNYNLSSVLVLEPKFTSLPQVGANGVLAMKGFFVSGAYRIGFDLGYAPDGGHWRLAAINVDVTSEQPAAPHP